MSHTYINGSKKCTVKYLTVYNYNKHYNYNKQQLVGSVFSVIPLTALRHPVYFNFDQYLTMVIDIFQT